MYDHVVLSM